MARISYIQRNDDKFTQKHTCKHNGWGGTFPNDVTTGVIVLAIIETACKNNVVLMEYLFWVRYYMHTFDFKNITEQNIEYISNFKIMTYY